MSLTGVAAVIQHFMDAAPAFPWGLVYLALVGIPVVVVHELGHAVVAAHRLDSEVQVSVGTTGKISQVRLGRVTASINLLAVPGRLGGLAKFDTARLTARDLIWISLAGPTASAAGGVLAVIAYRNAPGSGIAHDCSWAAVLESLVGVLNLIPFSVKERRDGPRFHTDGRLALAGLKSLWTKQSHSSGSAAISATNGPRSHEAQRTTREQPAAEAERDTKQNTGQSIPPPR